MKSRQVAELHLSKKQKPVIPDLHPFASPGISMEVISTDPSTGGFNCILYGKKGATFAPHLHLAGCDYLILSGALNYRDQLAPAGDSGYEPYGSIHEQTVYPEDTEMLFVTYGPLLFLDKDNKVVGILDSRWVEEKIKSLS